MRVIVYRNLRRADWSVAAATTTSSCKRGKVVAHLDHLTITNVSLHVCESARQRVIRNRAREVHAWAMGTLQDNPPTPTDGITIHYNPYRASTFTTRLGEPVHRADSITFTADGLAIARNPNQKSTNARRELQE